MTALAEVGAGAARPQPVLTLMQGLLPFDPDRVMQGFRVWNATGPYPVAIARLRWRYGPATLGPRDNGPVPRDRKAERRAGARLRQLRLVPVRTIFAGAHVHEDDLVLMDPEPDAWVNLVQQELPRLEKAGWDVSIAEDFPWRVAEPSGEVTFALTERAGTDWLDLEMGVEVDGVRVDLVPAVTQWLARPDWLAQAPRDLRVELPDGRTLSIAFARIQPILAPLLDLFEARGGPGKLRVARHDAGEIAALAAASAAAGIAWSGADAVLALGRQLRDHRGIPSAPAPGTFRATLRTYQQQGLDWLQFLRAAGLGGVLADDMGLGKTVQALAHLVIEQAAGRLDTPALVVCPTTLVPNWRAEAERFAPTLRTLVLHGPDRATRFPLIREHDLVITTYPLLARDHDTLATQAWHVVLLDEAQTIKNPLAAASRLARTLRAKQRLCLSGTPLENHLGELWSLFDFLMPGFLGDVRGFNRRYRGPIEKGGDMERQAMLARRVAPFLLRRTKAAVAADLPPKTEITETVEMEPAQRAIYESIRLAMHARVRAAIEERGIARSGIVILDALLKLRQVCCDPRLLKLPSTKKAGSAKLERLLELLPQMLEEGRRILLFSQFTSMLALIEAELDRMGLKRLVLVGSTRDRATPVARFQAGEVPLFLISLKAGGVGLNLTAADTVIHYDPWWNPAVEDQATDRAHRIGQDKPVFVHRLITTGTIEQKMEGLKARKQALADGILGAAGETSLSLTEGDLETLFAPVE